MKSINQQSKIRAFTLLEVLIAMVIFGYAATGLIASINNYKRSQVTAVQRTIGHWVAMNRLAETRLEKKWPNVGTTRGTSEMAKHTWYWTQIVSKTTEKELRQVEVEVRLDENDEIRVTSFIGFIANKAIKRK